MDFLLYSTNFLTLCYILIWFIIRHFYLFIHSLIFAFRDILKLYFPHTIIIIFSPNSSWHHSFYAVLIFLPKIDPISLNTCFTNQPAHGTERRQDTAGQHKRFVPFSNSSVLGSPGQFWMSGQGHHPIPLWPTQCHDMKTKSFRGQGCSMTLAKCNDRFGGSVLYPFEKGQILFNTLDRKLADLA